MDEFVNIGVKLHQVRLSYGFGRSKSEVLKGVSLNVSTGTIYGLLGPSGCGKTTLLRCVVGRLKPDKGFVKVFNHTPGLPKSNIPGSGVGYMPQEIALIRELTIQETLSYFGRLHHMTVLKVKLRTEFLLDFLNLPRKRTIIKNLSGGQQRRVSFAIALLHEPPLLILDEPTVGVDPVLRFSIWDHLLEICLHGGVTIIITTHYIEEARQANKVGLMRNGKILAENPPNFLMNHYNLGSLEEVFLKLCQEDAVEIDSGISYEDREIANDTELCPRKYSIDSDEKPTLKDYFRPPSLSRISALTIKNFIKMSRTLILLVFQFLNPAIQIILFCLAIGADPKNLRIAIFNEDNSAYHLGADYLSHLNPDLIQQVPVNDTNSGVDLVINGKAWGLIHIWQNFTPALIQRFLSPGNASDDIIEAATIHVRQDTTDQQITYFLQRDIMTAFQSFVEVTLTKFGQNNHSAAPAVEFEDPIYGVMKPSFTEYMAPGLILSIAYFMAVGLTSISFVIDKKEGLLDRSFVSGVTTFEVLCGHIITQLGVMAFQVGIILILALEAFDVDNRGSIAWVLLLALLQGMCGMTYGFFISTICEDETSAIMLALGSFYPCLLLSGTMWPVQAMPKFLQAISQALPLTIAIDAMRWIISRGRNITWMPVLSGFLVTLGWIA
uniref:ABC transporter domain-containing protein n=1 Tax=Strigamia maritima TaxID=126957 RepID=T1J7I8_STRMM